MKPYLEGLAVAGALLALSLALQYSAGQINWAVAAWPVNIALLTLLAAVILGMHCLRKRVHAFAWLSSYAGAISAMASALIAALDLGLIPQAPSTGTHAGWSSHLLSSWPFAIMYLWLIVSLGLTILRVGMRRWTWRIIAFMFNHLGLFVVLVAAPLGAADMQRLTMMVGKESMGYGPQSVAINQLSSARELVELDFALALKDFEVEYFLPDSNAAENGMPQPKSYTSYVKAYAKTREGMQPWGDTIIQVNKPLAINGWKVYQYGYDRSNGENARYSEFLLVKDPWLPWAFAGIFMMLGGALALFFASPTKKTEL